MVGPEAESGKPRSSRTENEGPPFRRIGQPNREELVISALDEGEGENKLSGAGDGWKHGGEGKGGVKHILTGSKLNACVLPVLDKSVQVLKEPPEKRTEGEEEEEANRPIEKRYYALLAILYVMKRLV